MTFNCSWEEFKSMAKEFHDNAPELNEEELDNAWKCLVLHYLGMNDAMWKHSAEILFKIESDRLCQIKTDILKSRTVGQLK